ncbi:hypothetical protein EGR_06979 [Echinococcus granulosus]|uniref:Uncharacterized protein n=1 Tax=Echinococcus granulosus TaxID=6210 RepID=W6UXA3_ECHGR|nr:hypothetical protein EGR_06979 [Echinococcus granulosus]EUB58149.1 hypothetical protein EGR_06979 [Echinococcus granulosus]
MFLPRVGGELNLFSIPLTWNSDRKKFTQTKFVFEVSSLSLTQFLFNSQRQSWQQIISSRAISSSQLISPKTDLMKAHLKLIVPKGPFLIVDSFNSPVLEYSKSDNFICRLNGDRASRIHYIIKFVLCLCPALEGTIKFLAL